jgi:hypothetical protein
VAVNALIALMLLWPAPEGALGAALVHVESRGNPAAVSRVGCVGRWQVDPVAACSRVGVPEGRPAGALRLAVCGAVAPRIAKLWTLAPLDRVAGRAVLARWRARCVAYARTLGAARDGHAPTSGRAKRQHVAATGVIGRRSEDSPTTGMGAADIATRCALRAYACGRAGMRGTCEWYADKVLAGVKL